MVKFSILFNLHSLIPLHVNSLHYRNNITEEKENQDRLLFFDFQTLLTYASFVSIGSLNLRKISNEDL